MDLNISNVVKLNNIARQVTLPDGSLVNAIGQGTWFMGEDQTRRKQEIIALRHGIELGMKVIDTAEMYGSGAAEILVGKAIEGIRDEVFLVSKVFPHNAGLKSAIKACETSLNRLNTEYLDLYLLHWRGNIPLTETVDVMEQLVAAGKIKRWGVSNLDVDDMQELWQITNGKHCMVNQVLYHLGSRGIEYDLLPWCKSHHVPIMAYCPLAQGGSLKDNLMNSSLVLELAKQKRCSSAQLLLAWCIRDNNVIAIPKATSIDHVTQNAQAINIQLTEEDLVLLNRAFSPPIRKMHLDIV